MFKKILTTFFILLWCGQAFAYHGKGFRILSERVEMTPGISGGLTELDDPKNTQFYATTKSLTRDKKGRVYEYVFLDADHQISIVNNTPNMQWYKYVVELNCHGKSFRDIKHIELSPSGTFTSTSKSFINVQEEYAGTYTINALTEVEGESSASHKAQATLKISKN